MQKVKRGLFDILKPVKKTIILAMSLNSLSAIFNIASIVLLSYSLSFLIEKKDLIIFGLELNLLNTILILALLIISSFLLKTASFTISHLGAFSLEEILRTKLSAHLAKVPLGVIISRGSGELKKVVQEDVRELHVFVADSTPLIARSLITPFGLIILFVVDWRLALASLAVPIFGIIAMSFAFKDSSYYAKKYENSKIAINKALIEFIQAMNVVRTFEDGSSSFKRYNNALDSFRANVNEWMDKTRLSGKLGMVILTSLPTLIMVFLISILLKNYDDLSLSAFILALFLSTSLAEGLMPLMWMNNMIRKARNSALKIFEILDIKELAQAKNPKIPANYDIEFQNVSFAYENSNNFALENISFKIPQNSKTALIGPSGSGKSTIAKLLPRFWDIDKGSIKIAGVDIREMEFETLMKTVSFVFQDTFLFNDSIYNNILLAKPNATKDEVYEAAKQAQIHDFILNLPNGYDTKAGDRGANLSGGQKQRITIARAILQNNPIIILDEASSFADPENEEEITKALAKLSKDKTLLIIAHRLTSIKDVEQIIVLNEGKIEEKGNHEELMSNKSKYFELYEAFLEASSWNLKSKGNDYE